eukprot:1186881-Rhodomonas_salina.1
MIQPDQRGHVLLRTMMLQVEGVRTAEFQANEQEFHEEVLLSLEELAGMDADKLRGHHLPLTITFVGETWFGNSTE